MAVPPGTHRRWVCTSGGVAASRATGQVVVRPSRGRVVVRSSTFRPPADLRTPMLMVGPGTGRSPLMGFLHHRGAQLAQTPNRNGATLGDARLYFGGRDLNDHLDQTELEGWRDAGLITHLAVDFSRASEKKTHVQHLIAEHGPEIWRCSAAPIATTPSAATQNKADDVFEALRRTARHHGGLTRWGGGRLFDRMKSERRFHADVWGITLNFASALQEVREAKYNQGERWLRQVDAAETPDAAAADQYVGAGGRAVTSA